MAKKKKHKVDSRPSWTTEARKWDARRQRTAGSSARVRRIVAVVGNIVGVAALLVGIGTVVWLLLLTAGGDSIGSVFADDVAGTTTIAFPTLMALLSLTGFIFGQFAVRGRWGMSEGGRSTGGSITVELRPIGVGLHVIFLMLSLIAWVLVMVVPVVLDAQDALRIPDGSSAREQFWFTVTVYGALTGALTAMIGLSLLKKLTYDRALARSTSQIRPGSGSQVWWRTFSYIWRAELGIGAVGGAALGLSPLGVHLDSPAYGLGAVAIGVLLMGIAAVTALNAWRSGLPVQRVESYT